MLTHFNYYYKITSTMIVASKILTKYIKDHPNKTKLAASWSIDRITLYNIMDGDNVGSKTISHICDATGFSMDDAFKIVVHKRISPIDLREASPKFRNQSQSCDGNRVRRRRKSTRKK